MPKVNPNPVAFPPPVGHGIGRSLFRAMTSEWNPRVTIQKIEPMQMLLVRSVADTD